MRIRLLHPPGASDRNETRRWLDQLSSELGLTFEIEEWEAPDEQDLDAFGAEDGSTALRSLRSRLAQALGR